MAITINPAAKKILEAIETKKYTKLDELWGELLENPPAQAAFYKQLAQALATAKRESKLVEFIALAMMQWAEQNRCADALKVVNLVLPYLKKNPADLHEPLLACVRAAYKSRANLERFIKASGLLSDVKIIPSYMALRLLLACDEGQVFRNHTRGVGVVTMVDEHEKAVEIDFGDGRPTRFSFDGVKQFLQPVPERHFLARQTREPEELKRWMEDDPAGFMKSLLRDFGGAIRQGELKTLLTERLLATREWNSWWSRNRMVIRLDPYIEYQGAANVNIVLRKTPRSFIDECAEGFEQAESWAERYTVLRQLARIKETEPIPEPIARRLTEAYDKALAEAGGGGAPGARLDAAFLGRDLANLLGGGPSEWHAADTKAMLAEFADAQAPIETMGIFEYQCQALADLPDVAEDWAETYAAMLLEAPPRLANILIKGLRDRGQGTLIAETLDSLFARPSINPELFVSACRQILESKYSELEASVPPVYALICLLDFMDELAAKASAEEAGPSPEKAVLAKIREILTADGYDIVIRVIRDVSTEEARHFLASIQGAKSLSDTYKMSVEAALRNVRGDLDDPEQRDQGGEHFVTAEALHRVREEYQHLKTVEIPANSRNIGEAAAMGDLRENADYDAAKAKQKLLFARVEELHDLLTRARPFDIEAVKTDVVGPGARVTARNLGSGAEERYTLLGMWDADLENNVLSYRSPFAAQFIGKAVGDRFEVRSPAGETTTYEILRIENALK